MSAENYFPGFLELCFHKVRQMQDVHVVTFSLPQMFSLLYNDQGSVRHVVLDE